MRGPVIGLAVLALLPAVAACASNGGAAASEESGSADLPATSWTLVGIGGSEPAGDAKPTIAFAPTGGTVSGNAGCNTFNGAVTIDGSTITFGPLATTRMACPEPQMAVESAYLAGLAGARTWRMDGGQLVLEGATELRFDEA